MVTVSRPIGINVGVNNPGDSVYIGNINANMAANETNDGSFRFIFDGDDEFPHIQFRADGVWNDTGLHFSSLLIGRDFLIKSAANFIKTVNPSNFSDHSEALIPHIPFTEDGTSFLHTPISAGLTKEVIFSSAAGEVSGTNITQTFSVSEDRFIKTIIYEVGTVGATSPVTHTIYKGTDNTGSLISSIELPTVDFIANTTVEVNVDSSIGFSTLQASIFIEMVTASSFTLKTDSNSDILLTLESQKADVLGVVTENLMLDEDLNVMLDESLDPMYRKQFLD